MGSEMCIRDSGHIARRLWTAQDVASHQIVAKLSSSGAQRSRAFAPTLFQEGLDSPWRVRSGCVKSLGLPARLCPIEPSLRLLASPRIVRLRWERRRRPRRQWRRRRRRLRRPGHTPVPVQQPRSKPSATRGTVTAAGEVASAASPRPYQTRAVGLNGAAKPNANPAEPRQLAGHIDHGALDNLAVAYCVGF